MVFQAILFQALCFFPAVFRVCASPTLSAKNADKGGATSQQGLKAAVCTPPGRGAEAPLLHGCAGPSDLFSPTLSQRTRKDGAPAFSQPIRKERERMEQPPSPSLSAKNAGWMETHGFPVWAFSFAPSGLGFCSGSFTHGSRPFDRLRAGCGLHSCAAWRLASLAPG